MLNSLHNSSKIFIVDQNSFYILNEVENTRIANAICRGILNISLMIVSVDDNYSSEKNYILCQQPSIHMGKYGAGNEAEILTTEIIFGKHKIKEIDFIPDKIIRLKEIISIRKIGFEILEQNLFRYMGLYSRFSEDDMLLHIVSKELDSCDPKNNVFSNGIHSWAKIMNVSVETAYKELKFDYDCTSVTILKLHAVWNKFMNLINSLNTLEEILQCVQINFETEIFVGYSNE